MPRNGNNVVAGPWGNAAKKNAESASDTLDDADDNDSTTKLLATANVTSARSTIADAAQQATELPGAMKAITNILATKSHQEIDAMLPMIEQALVQFPPAQHQAMLREIFPSNYLSNRLAQDPMAVVHENIFFDADFDAALHDIMDVTESYERETGKERNAVWGQQRALHKLSTMRDVDLVGLVKNFSRLEFNQRPAYWTAVCGEVMARHFGQVVKVN